MIGSEVWPVSEFASPRLKRLLQNRRARTPLNFISDKQTGGLSMDIRPLHDRVVVKRIEETENMQGGLYIPDSAKEKPQQGEVIAVGNGKRTDEGKQLPMDVKVGDRILFGKYSGSDIKLNGNEYMIMREDEILGVLANGSSGKK
jgi:chaperonin GroES